MKKKAVKYSLAGVAAALVLAVVLAVFVVNPALRDAYRREQAPGEMCLFLREGAAFAANLGLLPADYRREETPSYSLTAASGKHTAMTLWVWASGDSELKLWDFSVTELWSPVAGNADPKTYFTFEKEDRTIEAGKTAAIGLWFSPDEALTPGLWRALISVTAETGTGFETRTCAVDIFLRGESSVTLCRGGRSDWVVVEKADPTAAERAAVNAFVAAVRTVTGCELSIREDSEPVRGKEIVIGLGSRLEGDEELAGLATEDAYIDISADRILLTGKSDRGTLYAVYTFLAENLGYRQLTDEIAVTAKKKTVQLAPGARLVGADFALRALWSGEGEDWAFAMPNMLNAGNLSSGAQYGGSLVYAGSPCQMLEDLIPASQYYYSNKSFYSDKPAGAGGVRQLCLSREEVKTRITDKIIAMLDANSLSQRVSLRHYLCETPCGCAECSAINGAEGSPAGTYVRLVNAVAARIAESYPGVTVEMELAGAATARTATRPADNVLVLLSDAGLAQGKNYNENGFADRLSAWRDISAHVGAVLNIYGADCYLAPMADPVTMGENVRILRELGAEACIFADSGSVSGGEFGGLKAYVAATLARDAEYPVGLALHDYLYGVYGAAGGYVGEYLSLLSAALAEGRANTAEFAGEGLELLRKAEARCIGDGELLYRLRREMLSLRWVELSATDESERDEGYAAAVELFFDDCLHYRLTAISDRLLSEDKAAFLPPVSAQ